MSRKKKKIAILGCGWVGNALKSVLEETGDEVNCLSRDINMDSLVGFYACDVLIIAIPPSDDYADIIEDAYFSLSLNEALVTQVILLSSTSFYNNKKIVIEGEEMAKIKDEETVILRVGELMGYDRIAGKDTAGLTVEDGPTDYVHRDDVIGAISIIIEKNVKNRIFNVIAPVQSTKKEIYTQNAKRFNFDATLFSGTKSETKPQSSDILCEILGYKFKKEDVKSFWGEE